MQVKAISWMGVKTEQFDALTRFFRQVLHLPVLSQERDFVVFQLPNKDQVEVFGPSGPNQDFVPDSPVCGFLVDDIDQARLEFFSYFRRGEHLYQKGVARPHVPIWCTRPVGDRLSQPRGAFPGS